MTSTITAYQSLVEQDGNTDVHIRDSLLASLGFSRTKGIPLVFPLSAQGQMTSLANTMTDLNVYELVKVRVDITCVTRNFGKAILPEEVPHCECLTFESFAKEYRETIIARMRKVGKRAPVKLVGKQYFPTPKAIDWLIETQDDFKHLKAIIFSGPMPSREGAFINMLHIYDTSIISQVMNMTNLDQKVIIE